MNIAEDARGRPDHLLLPLAALLALPPVRPRQAATLHVEEVLREQPDQQHHRWGYPGPYSEVILIVDTRWCWWGGEG